MKWSRKEFRKPKDFEDMFMVFDSWWQDRDISCQLFLSLDNEAWKNRLYISRITALHHI